MKSVKEIIARILNPRAKYGHMPSFADSVEEQEGPGGQRSSVFNLRDILTNGPLVVGIVIVSALFLMVLFGPAFAPRNPYISGQHILPHLDIETGEYIRPPLLPSEEFPLGTNQWGTDILSMLLHGARTTLILSSFVALMRIVLGLTLGAAAGWNEGKLIDRLLMGLMGLITSLPMLISAMILIFVLDIRGGLGVFILALSVIGWSEIAQYVRSEFLILRKAAYIEGARASGLSGLQIAVRHIIPNIVPQLLVISFLEMGAVLMLLGELGFVGVYIGGGSRLDLSEPLGAQNIVTLIEIPEWGAMIADGYRWIYSNPHVVGPPVIAFFISVLGFNALGEGFRRLIEKHSLNTAFLLKKRMLAIIGGVTMAAIFIINNTGAGPWYARVAGEFDGAQAYAHIEALSAMEGRGIGQPGGEQAAAYIAEQFEAYGLEGGWRRNSYIHLLDTTIVRPIEQPRLAILDEEGNILQAFDHQIDFGYMITGHAGSGTASAPLTFVGFEPGRDIAWDEFVGLDLRGQIVLLFEENAPANFVTEALIRGALGVIWVVGDGRDDVRSQIQFSNPDLDYLRSPTLPVFRIRPAAAEAILEQAGTNSSELFNLISANVQFGSGWLTQDLDAQLSMSLQLGEPAEYQVPSVMGYLPGSDFDLASQLVILFVTYDSLGMDVDGTVFPGANHNAAGMGVLLEIARLWQNQGLSPRRTVLFMAWGGASLDESGARALVENSLNFRHLRTESLLGNTSPAILVQLDYIGAGGDTLLIHPNSSEMLFSLFMETNEETAGMLISAKEDTAEFTQDILTTRIRSWISVRWQGDVVLPTDDSIGLIDRDKLQQFGEFLALVLTKLVRETNL
ncbi:MAG: ABC transporter permease subunit [Chloroflexi bacterium]|nr:ABC transporter permease subunit [Chloroflexota bacterium]